MKVKFRGNAFLTAVAVAVAITGVAPAAASTDEGYRPSVWAQSGDRAPANATPSLSKDLGAQDGGGSGRQLGLCMLALGGLVLAFGLTRGLRRDRALRAPVRPRIRARLL